MAALLLTFAARAEGPSASPEPRLGDPFSQRLESGSIDFERLAELKDGIQPLNLSLAEGDVVCLVGGTLAERLQYTGDWEALLHARFPDRHLVVRNLGWSADELELRPRSLNFQDHGHGLDDHRATVVMGFFGFNESFAGREGLERFEAQLRSFIQATQGQLFNGHTPARLILVSPIAYEPLDGGHLPDGAEINANLALYTDALRRVAVAEGVPFIDLFSVTQRLYQVCEPPLTINGIHLTALGNRRLAPLLDYALFGPGAAPANLDAIRAAVIEKNRLFFFDYRAVNGYYIYGDRKEPFGVVNFPAEFERLRCMIARRDQTIWDVASGQAARPVDDSADPPLPAIVSNVEPDSIRDTTVAETLQSFQLAPGYRANCFASEEQFPNLAKPCQMAVDARGRVWVVTMPSYPMYLPGDPLPNDKVLIYEDVDRDGVADKETVFAEGLHLPTGIELGHGGCYVASQPNLLFLKDTDGDDRADHSEIVAHGFDSADSHHSISALTWGPDGALYMAEGTFHHTQIESPYGPRRVANAAVFRFHPVNWRWDIFVSYGFANPWGQTFDDWGQYFVADASGGDNYFGTAFSGDVVYPNKHNRMRTFIDMQWRPTAGCELVSSRHFREQDQGNFLLNNCIGFQGVLQYRITEEESGFRGRPTTPLLQSSDRNFRPVDLEFGADGALYVVDWYNPLIGHMQHSIRDPHRDKSRGRLWRITCDENPTVPIVALDALTTDQLLDQLLEPEYRTRYRTRRELVARDTATVVAALDRWAAGVTPGDPMASRRLIEALWLAESLDEFKPQLLDQALAWPDGRVRAAATRVLGNWRDRIPDALARLVSLAADPNPRVRLEAVRAASFFEGDAARRVADEALFRPMDDYLKYAYDETLRTLDHRAPSPVGSTAARLIARAQNEPLDEAPLGRLLELVSERATADELQWVLDQATDERVPLAARRAAWRGLATAARQRHCLATGFRDWAAKSLADAWPTDESISTSVVDLCGAWRIEEAVPQLSRLADATTATPAAFRPIAQSLAEIGSEAALARLRELASKPGLAAPLREECLLALVAVGEAQGQRDVLLALALATANDALADPGRVERAVQAFLSHPSGATQLADVMRQLDAADQLPTALALAIRRAIKRLGAADAELDAVVNRLAGIEPRGPLTDAEANHLARLVSQRGDAERGQEIFRRADLGCYKCHALGGAGGNVGPELAAIGTTSPVDYLIRAILAPDADVKESYKTRKFLTVEGRIVSGIVTRRDPGVVTVRQSDDTLVAIPTEDIDDEADGRSQMPDGIADELTDEQLADLVAFLHQLGRDEASIPSTPRVLAWLAAADLPVGNGDVWAFDSTDGVWARPAYARIDGQLPLAELFQDLGAREQVRLVAGIDCTVGGNVQLKLHGDPVSLHWDSQAQEISANGTATVDCEPGVHWITIQVERPKSADAALTLELARADGSPIEFSVLGSAGLASSLAH